MPGYQMRIVRNDGLVVYDSGGTASRINVSALDKPPVGTWTYTLQIKGVNTDGSSFYTRSNTIAGILLGR